MDTNNIIMIVTDLALQNVFPALVKDFRARRSKQLRDILMRKIKRGSLYKISEDELLACCYKLSNATIEGVAVKNIELMAEYLDSGAIESDFTAHEFAAVSASIASLSSAEIMVLAEFVADGDEDEQTWKRIQDELIGDGRPFASVPELESVVQKLTKTGWIIAVSGFGRLTYKSTPSIDIVRRRIPSLDAFRRRKD